MRVWVQQKIKKTHMCGVGVCGMKSYCAQSVRVCQNLLHANTLKKTQISIITKYEVFLPCQICGDFEEENLSMKSLAPTEMR